MKRILVCLALVCSMFFAQEAVAESVWANSDEFNKILKKAAGGDVVPLRGVITKAFYDKNIENKLEDYTFLLKLGMFATMDGRPDLLEWYRVRAKANDASAQFILGGHYAFGKGVERNYDLAMEWYEKAAQQQKSDIYCVMAMYAEYSGKYDEGYEWVMKAVSLDNAFAKYMLGEAYEYGWGVGKNEKEAFKWYMIAAKKGVAKAQNTVGVSYFQGNMVDKDTHKAYKWFLKAANQGDADAQYNLGNMLKNRGMNDAALQWKERAVLGGHVQAMFDVAQAYIKGEGLEKNMEKGLALLKQCAAKKSANAQYYLATLYNEGKVIAGDKAEAFRWYLAAAQQGLAIAQYNVGAYYFNGVIEKDQKKGIEWFGKAAQQNDAPAKEVLKKIMAAGLKGKEGEND